MIHLEFSEQQQAFHHNYEDSVENSNGYKTLFTGSKEQIKALSDKVQKLKEIRDNGFLTFERAKEIINN